MALAAIVGCGRRRCDCWLWPLIAADLQTWVGILTAAKKRRIRNLITKSGRQPKCFERYQGRLSDNISQQHSVFSPHLGARPQTELFHWPGATNCFDKIVGPLCLCSLLWLRLWAVVVDRACGCMAFGRSCVSVAPACKQSAQPRAKLQVVVAVRGAGFLMGAAHLVVGCSCRLQLGS